MPVASSQLSLVYYDVPKVACTSLKTWFWELEHGQAFTGDSPRDRVLNRLGLTPKDYGDIHRQESTRTRSFKTAPKPPADYATLAVVRDPIRRLVSAWKDKVNAESFKRKTNLLLDLENEGLVPNPDFETFIEHFDEYRMVTRATRIHTNSLAWHLGPDIGFYDHVFSLEALDELIAFLSGKLGKEVSLPRQNTSHSNRSAIKLSSAQVDRILEITRPDYQWLGSLYNQQDSLEQLLGK